MMANLLGNRYLYETIRIRLVVRGRENGVFILGKRKQNPFHRIPKILGYDLR